MGRFYFLPPLVLQTILHWPIYFIFKFFCHLKIQGIGNLPSNSKGVIFASNHISECDPILLPSALPFLSFLMPMFFVSRNPSFYDTSGVFGRLFYGGWIFRIFGAYPAYKKGLSNRHLENSLETHIKILEKGGSVCIFPEGQLTLDGRIQKGKVGVGFLAYETKTTIVPVRIDGAFRINMKDFLLRKRFVVISFGKPLEIQDFPNDEYTDRSFRILFYKKATDIIMMAIKNL